MIPALSLPVSLIGALSLLYPLGYSLDNISLLGITLAVGLVVDDAIVMLENIVRHIEDGMAPFEAAHQGRARDGVHHHVDLDLAGGGVDPDLLHARRDRLLFHEFAVVVGLSILVSALVSLTLVPMLASRFLRHHQPQEENALGRAFERGFDAMQRGYARSLDWALAHRVFIGCVAIGSVVLTGVLFVTIPKGFFPEEDIGQISVTTEAAEDISFAAMEALHNRVADVIRTDPAVDAVGTGVGNTGFSATTQNTGRMFVTLKPRSAARADAAGGRRPAPQGARGARHRGVHAAGAEPAIWAAAPARAATSTRCKASAPTRSTSGPTGCRNACAPTRCSAT